MCFWKKKTMVDNSTQETITALKQEITALKQKIDDFQPIIINNTEEKQTVVRSEKPHRIYVHKK